MGTPSFTKPPGSKSPSRRKRIAFHSKLKSVSKNRWFPIQMGMGQNETTRNWTTGCHCFHLPIGCHFGVSRFLTGQITDPTHRFFQCQGLQTSDNSVRQQAETMQGGPTARSIWSGAAYARICGGVAFLGRDERGNSSYPAWLGLLFSSWLRRKGVASKRQDTQRVGSLSRFRVPVFVLGSGKPNGAQRKNVCQLKGFGWESGGWGGMQILTHGTRQKVEVDRKGHHGLTGWMC